MVFQRKVAGRLMLGLVIVLGLVLSGTLIIRAAIPAAADAPAPWQAGLADPAVIPGQLVIGVPPGTAESAVMALLVRHGATLERWLPDLGLALARVPIGMEARAVQALANEQAVDFATPHRRSVQIADAPLDEYWPQQWGPIKAQGPSAWDVTWGDPSVVIAVIDTGANYGHLDLRDQLWRNPGESLLDPITGQRTCATWLAQNGADDDENGYPDDCLGYDFSAGDNNPADEHGHGTAVAGIAAAAVNNPDPYISGGYEGIAGMGRRSTLMVLRALDASGVGAAFNVAEAIHYAGQNGAWVINLSLTLPVQYDPADADMLCRAIAAAQAQGALVVGASGNNSTYYGYPVSYPAACAGVLAVGASKRDDTRAIFSNYGARLDLVAPGEGIYSTLRVNAQAYGLYGSTGSGTSFAAPHVAGATALVRSLRPDLDQAAICELVRHTADDVADPGWDAQTGWGRLNAARAVSEAAVGLGLGLVAEPPSAAAGGQAVVRLAITAPGGAVAGLGARVTFSATGGVISPSVVSADGLGQAHVRFTAGPITGTAHITATLAGVTATVPVTVTSGQPTNLTLIAAPPIIASGGGRATITATVRDEGGSAVADGVAVTFTTTLGSVDPLTATTVGGQAGTVLTSGVLSGTAIVQATAGSLTATIPVAILGAGDPYTVTLTATPSELRIDDAAALISATVTDAFGDKVADGTAVAFATDLGSLSAPAASTIDGRAVVQLTPGALPGTAHITAAASRASGRLALPIQPGQAVTVTVTTEPVELVAGYNQVAQVRALAVDRYGNRVAQGTVLAFAASLGQLVAFSSPTLDGVAQVSFLGETVAGTSYITVTAPGGAQGGTAVRIRPAAPATIDLEALPAAVAVGGETARLKATVRDIFGNAAADGAVVTFTTNLGVLRAAAAGVLKTSPAVTGTAQTVGGVAEILLASGEVAGTADVRAAVDALAAMAEVVFMPGPAAALTLTVDPPQVRIGGRTELQAWVTDRFGNPVTDGTTVTFLAHRGALSQMTVPALGGIAAVTLTVASPPGPVQVAAHCGVSAFEVVEVLPAAVYLPVVLR